MSKTILLKLEIEVTVSDNLARELSDSEPCDDTATKHFYCSGETALDCFILRNTFTKNRRKLINRDMVEKGETK